jgi:Flp pilus assembly protein CpaB
MRLRHEDFVAVLAITCSGAFGAGLTAALLSGRGEPAAIRMDVPGLIEPPQPISVRIPDDQRAITFKVDDVLAVSGRVRPGAVIDVMVSPDATGDVPDSRTRVVVQNARVLGNDRALGGQPASSMVTLLVTPEDAERIAVASTEGELHVVLHTGGAATARRVEVRRSAP